ncbi:hypothetical protein [Alteribacillus sp. HJP-4]|uniref:hypothetical protein n=1 Tax=Alteribacillus sp. HJP-4 TaxID=2775394 RepID=UPI0035CCE201
METARNAGKPDTCGGNRSASVETRLGGVKSIGSRGNAARSGGNGIEKRGNIAGSVGNQSQKVETGPNEGKTGTCGGNRSASVEKRLGGVKSIGSSGNAWRSGGNGIGRRGNIAGSAGNQSHKVETGPNEGKPDTCGGSRSARWKSGSEA